MMHGSNFGGVARAEHAGWFQFEAIWQSTETELTSDIAQPGISGSSLSTLVRQGRCSEWTTAVALPGSLCMEQPIAAYPLGVPIAMWGDAEVADVKHTVILPGLKISATCHGSQNA